MSHSKRNSCLADIALTLFEIEQGGQVFRLVWLGTSYRPGPSVRDSVDRLVLELEVARGCPGMDNDVV